MLYDVIKYSLVVAAIVMIIVGLVTKRKKK
jgi:hypothetical protein